MLWKELNTHYDYVFSVNIKMQVWLFWLTGSVQEPSELSTPATILNLIKYTLYVNVNYILWHEIVYHKTRTFKESDSVWGWLRQLLCWEGIIVGGRKKSILNPNKIRHELLCSSIDFRNVNSRHCEPDKSDLTIL